MIDDKLDRLNILSNRIESITKNQIKYLKTYYEKNANMFSRPSAGELIPFTSEKTLSKEDDNKKNTNNGTNNGRGNIYEFSKKTGKFSTCLALNSLLVSDHPLDEISDAFSKIISNDNSESKFIEKTIFEYFVDKLLYEDTTWFHSSLNEKFDVYTTPFKLDYLKKMRTEEIRYELIKINSHENLAIDEIKELITTTKVKFDKNPLIKQSLNTLIEKIDNIDPIIRFSKEFDKSSFLSYWNMKAITEWFEILEIKQKQKLSNNFRKIFEWSKNQLYRQMTFYSNNISDRMDPIRAIYCLHIYKTYYEFYYNQGEQIEKNGLGEYNEQMVNILANYVIKKSKIDGIFKKYLPVAYKNDKYLNEAYVYPFPITSIEMLLRMIKIDQDNFDEIVILIKEMINWIEKNDRKQYVSPFDEPVPMSNLFSGWRSPHSIYPQGHPECWSTSLTFESLLIINRIIKENMAKIVLKKFNGKTDPQNDDFVKRWDSVIKYPADSASYLSLKKIIFHNIIEPRLKYNKISVWKDFANAFLLYGPPGTGKSSLVESIASMMGWSYLRIDTGIFLENGLDKVGKTASDVFNYLKHLEKTVILFDEIDELIQERKESSSIENKLLTNTMLTLLNDLTKNKKIIYFIATNYANRIDQAIIRPGRIDFKLFVDYPSIDEFLNDFRLTLKDYIIKICEKDLQNKKLIELKNSYDGEKINDDISEFNINLDKIMISFENSLIKVINERKTNASQTDLSYEKSKQFKKILLDEINLLIPETEDVNEINAKQNKLKMIVNDYFGIVKEDKENDVSPSFIGLIYPLIKTKYEKNYSKTLSKIYNLYKNNINYDDFNYS